MDPNEEQSAEVYDYGVEHVSEIEPYEGEEELVAEEFDQPVYETEYEEEDQEDVDTGVYTADGQFIAQEGFASGCQEGFIDAYPQAYSARAVSKYHNKTWASVQNTTVFVFALVWMMLGVASFLTSLLCFADDGIMEQKLLGFVFAIVFGPLYMIYLFASKSYCPNVRSGLKRFMRMKK